MTLRVAFLGNDVWSVPSLDAIAAEPELSLVQVVTNPPKEAGRLDAHPDASGGRGIRALRTVARSAGGA